MSNSMQIDQYQSPKKMRIKLTSPLSDKKIQHREMFKTPPRWFKNYREKCLSELNCRRQERQSRLVESFRKIDLSLTDSKDSVIRDVMHSVWKEVVEPFIDEETQFNNMNHHYFLKQIKEELLVNENNYWESLFEQRNQEEIDWAIENQHSSVCFNCRLNYLTLTHFDNNKMFICPKCNFRLFVEHSITQEILDKKLNIIIDEHGRQCNKLFKFEPIFDHRQSFPVNIKFTCFDCKYFNNLFV